MAGYATAALAVLIFASYPVVTRADVTEGFRPEDLVLLRFGVASLLFLPYMLCRFHTLPGGMWRKGAWLSVYQGAGMAALVVCGLQFAPASHAAALGPGVAPLWTVLFAALLFGRRPSRRQACGVALIALGALAVVCVGTPGLSYELLLGDAMFLGASALGALYFLRLRESGIGALPGAAVVSLYSAAAAGAWFVATETMPFTGVAFAEIFWQVIWQGVLIGFVALIALNHAVSVLGGERTAALIALVPVAGMLLGDIFLAEVPSSAEWIGGLSISLGVALTAGTVFSGAGSDRQAGAL